MGIHQRPQCAVSSQSTVIETSDRAVVPSSAIAMVGVRGNLFPGEFVPRELFPEGICSVQNKFPGYNFFRAREFVPHLGNLFPVYLPYRTSRYFVLHAWYTVLQVVGPG